MNFEVIKNTSKTQRELASEMCDRIKGIVYEYSDLVPVALAVGAMEIAKMEIMDEQK